MAEVVIANLSILINTIMGKKLTQEQFIKKAKKIHGDKYDYALVLYRKNSIKIKIICQIHGMFSQTPRDHLTGRGCFECSRKKRSQNQKMTISQFVKNAQNIHGNKYNYQDINFINNKSKIIIQCKNHGPFLQTVASHLFGCGCPHCGIESRIIKNTLTTYEFIDLAKKEHGNKYDYPTSIYYSAKIPIEIICKKHGKFHQKPNDHLGGHGCPKCNKTVSSMESKWLDIINVPNDKQHRTVTIKTGNKRFSVDGFDPLTKTIYEFYGDFWHGNPSIYNFNDFCKITKKTFGQMYSDTLNKEKILKEHGYTIVSIWEHDFRNTYEKY
jgi:Zn finger protein HypA/HybF involved in hydrogenase expression